MIRMCQYVLLFRALVRQRFDDGSLEMNHYMYFRRLVKSLHREVEEIDRIMGKKTSKKVKKCIRKAKNDN
ncbi:hypothetical protein [uncultured Bacteroides sp.]|uniref:hypothetical protein n=1 Tax=uncultured Bacteroides sp. TaxID=162156 RepID=UPI002609E88D|nr:hypothetical protein [uncultured Bacteroides sp.]